MNTITDRQAILQAALLVAGGQALKRYSPDTIFTGGMCAQLVRESVEGALGLPANGWEVAEHAHKFRLARKGAVRWASDYELAARELGLNKAFEERRGGDVLYWPYRARNGNNYGHTAVYLGLVNGVECVLENSDWAPADRRQAGAGLPLDGLWRGGTTPRPHVYVTPLKLFRAAPTTIVTPTLAILKAELVPPPPAPIVTVPDPNAPLYLRVPVLGLDGRPEAGLVSIPMDAQGRVLKQRDGLVRVYRVPEGRS